MKDATLSSQSSLMNSAFEGLLHNPYRVAIALLVFLCISTRLISGIRASNQDYRSPVKRVKLVPYWIPYLGSVGSFAWDTTAFIGRERDKTKDNVVAINMGATAHHFILSPSLIKSFFSQRTMSLDELGIIFMENFGGDPGTLGKNIPRDVLWGTLHKVLGNFMREEFLTKGTEKTVRELKLQTPTMVSFCHSPIDQHLWEKNTSVMIEGPDTAIVDFFGFIRNFVGHIGTRVLMGESFLENYPEALSDLWAMDDNFNLLMLGLPSIVPGMTSVYAARKRFNKGVGQWYDALQDTEQGKDPGYQWNDMNDVSDVFKLRSKVWKEINGPKESTAPGFGVILWATNANANAGIFWVLYNIFSNTLLHSRILSEIVPYANLSDVRSGFSPELYLDAENIFRSCPLLRATYFETMRLSSNPFSYKKVSADTILTESTQDAQISGKDSPQSYLLPAGTFAAIPHGVVQSDPKIWPDPKIFKPERFLVPDTKSPAGVKAEMGNLYAYGGGITMCKGRTFAEREILLFAAAILTCWDVEPVDITKGWTKPKRLQASAVDHCKEYRVRMRRKVATKGEYGTTE